ncbi:MAG: PQQ-binding-like beta-propeller repeat protein [Acidobacteria bacterium]|nr:PQQ-binding-like beta-propeller repeat protein [Acidobacteriota bacterium]
MDTDHRGLPKHVLHHDPALNLTYWGVGNGSPWTGDARPGDNLYTNSTLALDADSGEIEAYHQYHWNGSWDWDEASAPLLIDLERGPQRVGALVHPGRNGYLWVLERGPDSMRFMEGRPFVHQDVFAGVDPFSGRPAYDLARVPGIGKRVQFCPAAGGARNWWPEAFSPQTGLLYVSAANNLCSVMEGLAVEYEAGQPYFGAAAEEFMREGADHVGELQAWDLDTGRRAWTQEFPVRGGSVLATAGELVFFDAVGDFMAFDARSGEMLWEYSLNPTRPTGVATSYAVGGVQYVAVQFEARRAVRRLRNGSERFPRGNLVVAFALDCQC